MRRRLTFYVLAALVLIVVVVALRAFDRAPKGQRTRPVLPTMAHREAPDGTELPPERAERPDEDDDVARVTCRLTEPWADAQLFAVPAGPDLEDLGRVDGTRAGDVLSLSLPPGRWFLAWRAGADEVTDDVGGELGEQELHGGDVLTCELASRGLHLRGTVTSLDGTPIEGAEVTACGVRAESDADGRWELDVSWRRLRWNGNACHVRSWWRDGLLQRPGSEADVSAFEAHAPLALTVDTEPVGGMGIGIRASDDGIEVTSVEPGSPAAAAGLLPGDLVLEVDGASTAEMPVETFVAKGVGRPGTSVTLTLLDEEGERSVTLYRARLAERAGP